MRPPLAAALHRARGLTRRVNARCVVAQLLAGELGGVMAVRKSLAGRLAFLHIVNPKIVPFRRAVDLSRTLLRGSGKIASESVPQEFVRFPKMCWRSLAAFVL